MFVKSKWVNRHSHGKSLLLVAVFFWLFFWLILLVLNMKGQLCPVAQNSLAQFRVRDLRGIIALLRGRWCGDSGVWGIAGRSGRDVAGHHARPVLLAASRLGVTRIWTGAGVVESAVGNWRPSSLGPLGLRCRATLTTVTAVTHVNTVCVGYLTIKTPFCSPR